MLDIVVSRDTLSDSVADQIKGLIAEKRIKVGEKLPSQRILADQLKVGRPSIREALKKLQAMGIVKIQQGRKTVVQSTNVETLMLNMSHVLELTQADVVCLIETKELIEAKCAALASELATEEELGKLGEYLQQMKEGLYDDQVFAEFDYLFHLKVVEAAKNPILIVIVRMLGNMIKKALIKTAELHSWRDRTYMLHKKYYEAICRKDSEKAVGLLHKIESETISRLKDKP